MPLSRRQFLAASAALASGGAATAIDPIKRPSDKPDLKLSLAAYSFRQALDLKKPTMTLFEFIERGHYDDYPLKTRTELEARYLHCLELFRSLPSFSLRCLYRSCMRISIW